MEIIKKTDPFYTRSPKMAIVEITTRCNLSCTYCLARKLVSKQTDQPLEKLELVHKQLANFEYILLSGLGEPLTHKDFYDVIRIFKDQQVVLVTNGSVPIDFERLNRFDNIEAITFSVDSGKEQTLGEMCPGYTYKNLLMNLKLASEYGIEVGFNTTLTSDNAKLEELSTVLDLIAVYGVKKLSVGLPMGQEKWVKENIDSLKELTDLIEKEAKGMGIEFQGPFEKICTFEETPIVVTNMQGNVFPCCDYYACTPLVGNLFKANFETLWQTERYESFRTGKHCAKCNRYHNKKY